MRPLEERLEVVTTKADVDLDDKWQILDLEALMAPYRERTTHLDAPMAAAVAERSAAGPGDAPAS